MAPAQSKLKKNKGPLAVRWCFTYNNYDASHVPSSLPPDALYFLAGREISPSGTPHLQGLVIWNKRKLRTACKKFLDCHWEICKSVPASVKYCKKDGDYVEFGVLPKGKGSRSDLEKFKKSVKSGVYDIVKLRETHSSVCARYPHFVSDYIRDNLPGGDVEDHPLIPWQAELNADLKKEPDKRCVYFIVGRTGSEGKSWFCSYYHSLHKSDTLILESGKRADMAHALRQRVPYPRVVFVDVPRSKMEHLQFDFIEKLKDGRIFCGKYQSTMIEFPVPHVIVMCNEYPDMSKLSEDRYIIRPVEFET